MTGKVTIEDATRVCVRAVRHHAGRAVRFPHGPDEAHIDRLHRALEALVGDGPAGSIVAAARLVAALDEERHVAGGPSVDTWTPPPDLPTALAGT